MNSRPVRLLLVALIFLSAFYSAFLFSGSENYRAWRIVLQGTLLAVLGGLKWSRGVFSALVVVMASYVWTFYDATGAVIRIMGRPDLDSWLIEADRVLFGWAFVDGQISLSLDQNDWIGPHTYIGKLVSETLQLFYFSYYLWGYILLLLLVYRFWTRNDRISLERFLVAWLGAYLVNYLFYILVPAIGPQFVFENLYVNDVRGFGLAGATQDFIRAQQSTRQDCFPSGHTALSWITAIYGRELAPRFGKYALIAAVLITCATIYLRFHYIVDVIAAIGLILFARWAGSARHFQK